ncbi:hypothetical protein KP509_28G013500 [Ceratopteris richardii]|uniref:mRNA guanylyltransferase n=1 Tax=Ceratopteris richardii TaxID=49495 RepID=A0A8T2RBV4_CERRI|nr:hypothetical protein KP509_28G013500 [Ceratopteris richardii]KAH7293138.1 hypothetical protein KP509_28G013500 [Ceratopteris richardii]KAH7293139.1 hypothetical protein KP509_28G013500 [Ceratopteris richardii]
MDLNELPTDEREECKVETAVETLRREREERRMRMEQKRKANAILEPNQPTSDSSNYRSVDRIKSYKVSYPKLPEGWVECPRYGQPIYGLIPSKVPLGSHFNEVVEAGKRYSARNAIQQLRARGKEVGMVIDLTNTTRYYQSSEWRESGIKYLKIPCRGRNEVPDNESVNIFVFEVMHFMNLQRATGTFKHVLVHCTHGFNRTGYMIIQYMKRTIPSMTVEKALAEFATARSPGIYKAHYIQSLFTFFHERHPEPLVAPSTPEWKRVDLNGEANGDDDDGESDGGILTTLEDTGSETMTNDDILGDPIPDLQQLEMQKICYMGLHLNPPTGTNHLHFPGSQPVSLSSANLQLLRQRYYYATWKADGTRYMMFITRDGCFLIDRKFHFRRVQMRFPIKAGSAETHHLTLLDGEMVIDEIPETHERKRRYLIYDVMMLNHDSLVQLPFHERWRRIHAYVIEPRSMDRKKNNWYCYEAEPFTVRRKDFWLLSTTEKLLHSFIKHLSHEADGLIFQGWDDPYYARTNESLLKWKYAHMNSVDFKFQVSADGSSHQLFLIDKNKLWPLEGASVVFPHGEDPNMLSGKIIECSWLRDERKWEFMRIRTDKETPNAVRTYRKVMESIEDNITEEVLLSEIHEILHLPMYKERIQHDQRKMLMRGN